MLIYLRYLVAIIFAGLAVLFLGMSIVSLFKHSKSWVATQKGVTSASNYFALSIIGFTIAIIAYLPSMAGIALVGMVIMLILSFVFYLFQSSMLKVARKTGADRTLQHLIDHGEIKYPRSYDDED